MSQNRTEPAKLHDRGNCRLGISGLAHRSLGKSAGNVITYGEQFGIWDENGKSEPSLKEGAPIHKTWHV